MPPRSLRLRQRDLDVLASLSDYRFLSVPQLAALHFGNKPTAVRRMNDLTRGQLTTKVFMPVRPYDRKVTSIFALAKPGAHQLARRGDGTVPKYVTEKDRRSSLFLDHTLRRNDLRACLELLDRHARGFRLETWKQTPEDVGGEAFIRTCDGNERVPCVPDGYAEISLHGERQGILVEIDLGTVAMTTMYNRYRAYYRWWKAGGMAQRFGKFPLRVLTLSTTPARLGRLRGAALSASPGTGGSGLFWFAPLDIADLDQPARLLGRAWTVARRGDQSTQTLF